jgi:hypothetical protein
VTDLFEEVEEQLRSDRYKQFAQKGLPWLLGLAAAAIIAFLAYWGYDTWRTQQNDKASETYAAAIEAMGRQNPDEARRLWGEVAKSSAPAYKALSLMHLAAYEESQRRTAEAVKMLDEAAKTAPDELIGDAARLKSALALLDTAPFKDLEGRLKPLMEEGRPYRIQAREALAFAKLRTGDLTGARGDFVLISQSLDAAQGAQARAQAAIGLIDSGSAKQVGAIAQAAAALPPPMMIPPGAVPGAPQPEAAAPQ